MSARQGSLPSPLPLSAVVGVVVCAGLGLVLDVRWPELLLAVGALIVVPLALLSVDAPARDGTRSAMMHAVRVAHLPCALCLAVALVLDQGALAAWLTVPWTVFTALVALLGATRIAARGLVPLEELALDAGLLQLAVGGVWLLASRAQWQLLGFDDTWVVLTAAHFHFAGLALSVLAGLHGRAHGLPRLLGWTLVLGPPAVAAGITFSRPLEVVASWVLALAALAFALLQGRAATRDRGLPRAWLLVSSTSLAAGMLLALAFSLGRYLHWPRPTIGDLLVSHAPLNAIGFALFGIVARSMQATPMRRRDVRPTIASLPLSLWRKELRGQGRGLGLVDAFDRYGLGREVHSEVRRFYERTSELELVVRPKWRAAFVPFARLVVALATRMGNLVLPLPGSGPERVRSEIVAMADGRRASTRTYEDGRPMYLAAYGHHDHLMNIALPLPGVTMVSILRMEPHEVAGAIRLTSITRRERPDDEGLYLRIGRLVVALPLSEVLELYPRDVAPHVPDFATASTTLVARHVFRVCGIVCLELDYAIGPLRDRGVSLPA